MTEKRARQEAAEPEKQHKKAKQCSSSSRSSSSNSESEEWSLTGLLLRVDGTMEVAELPSTGLVEGYEEMGYFAEDKTRHKLQFLTALDCPLQGKRNVWYEVLEREFDVSISTTGPIMILDCVGLDLCDLRDDTFEMFRKLTPSAEDVANAGDVTSLSSSDANSAGDTDSEDNERSSVFRAHASRLRDAQLDSTKVIMHLVRLLGQRDCKTVFCDVCNIVSTEEQVCRRVQCGYCRKSLRACGTCDMHVEAMTPVECCLACARSMADGDEASAVSF